MIPLSDRSLPHSAESERAVLGALILDNGLVDQAIELLKPEDFYVRAHQLVFRTMTRMSERGAEINPILLGEELRRDGTLEQVGGVTVISELTYGLPRITNIAPYAMVVKDKSRLRQLIKAANKITSAALEEEDEADAIIENSERLFSEMRGQSVSAGRTLKLRSFAELMAEDFADGERVAWEACRGEIVLVQSVTNHGKSTLIRNSALALATGGECLPVVERGQPRKVLLLNLEGSGGRFQSDLKAMARDFTSEEMALVRENFLAVHRPLLHDGQLSLSRHLRLVEREARRHQVDVVIVDTAAKAFTIRNENDNAEVANFVMKPLDDLACKLNCLIVLVHHIGKAKSEDGATREQAHRGRGASAWGDFSTSIFNLEADPQDQSRVTLTCGKRKNGENYERVLRLDRESRWFRVTDDAPAKPVTNDDLVLEAMTAIKRTLMATAEIEDKLIGRVKRTTLMNSLKRLADSGKVFSPQRALWSLREVCPTCHAPLVGMTSCTNYVENEKPFTELKLAQSGHLAVNGNGWHGA